LDRRPASELLVAASAVPSKEKRIDNEGTLIAVRRESDLKCGKRKERETECQLIN
jgi:hypothetical protein